MCFNMTCGAVWLFILTILDYVQILFLFLAGAVIGTISKTVDAVTEGDVEESDFENLITFIYIQAVVTGILNLATLILLSRYICCTDTFAGRVSALWGIRVRIANGAFNLLYIVLVWVAIIGSPFEFVQDILIGIVAQIGLWAWWHKSYARHS